MAGLPELAGAVQVTVRLSAPALLTLGAATWPGGSFTSVTLMVTPTIRIM